MNYDLLDKDYSWKPSGIYFNDKRKHESRLILSGQQVYAILLLIKKYNSEGDLQKLLDESIQESL